MFIVRVSLFQLDDWSERASFRLVSVGVEDGGGTGLITIVAVTVFEFWDFVRVWEVITYPESEIHKLGDTVVSQVKPVYLVQVLEQPSPPKVFPSSHSFVVVESITLFPHIYKQGAASLVAL